MGRVSCGITTFSSVQRADRRFELLARDRWWLGAPVLEIGFARARASLPAAAPGRNAGVRAQRSGGSRRSAAAAVPRLPLGSRAGSLRLVEEGRVHVDSRADRLKGARLSPTWERTARSFRVPRTSQVPIRFAWVLVPFWRPFGTQDRTKTAPIDSRTSHPHQGKNRKHLPETRF